MEKLKALLRNWPTWTVGLVVVGIFVLQNKKFLTAEQVTLALGFLGVGGVGVAHRLETPAAKKEKDDEAAKSIASNGMVFLCIFLVGCGPGALQKIASAYHAANEIGRAISTVAGWCEDNGASVQKVVTVVEAVKKEDYGNALVVTKELVDDLKKLGVPIPEDKADLLLLAEQAYAAKAVEQFGRAMAGRDENGKLK